MQGSSDHCNDCDNNLPMMSDVVVDLEEQRLPVISTSTVAIDVQEESGQDQNEVSVPNNKSWSHGGAEEVANHNQADMAAERIVVCDQRIIGDVDDVDVDYDNLANHSSLAYGGIIVSATVLLVALMTMSSSTTKNASSFEDHRYYHYGLAVGSVALIVSAFGWGLAQLTMRGNQSECFVKNTLVINYFLFLWCFIGSSILTFGGPFDVAGNGTLRFS